MDGQIRNLDPRLNELSKSVIGSAIEVHKALGPGLLERIYEEAFVHELGIRGFKVERQLELSLAYKGIVLRGQRLDLLVERQVILELKSVEKIADVHLALLLSYLRAANLQLGLLINFNCDRLIDGVRRRVNGRALGPSMFDSAISANTPAASALRSEC